MRYSKHNLGEVLSLKTVTASASKEHVALGVQNACKFFFKVPLWMLDLLPIKEAMDLVGKLLDLPGNPLRGLEMRITVKSRNATEVFNFLRDNFSLLNNLVRSF